MTVNSTIQKTELFTGKESHMHRSISEHYSTHVVGHGTMLKNTSRHQRDKTVYDTYVLAALSLCSDIWFMGCILSHGFSLNFDL
jgi:hypothetical protein